MQHSEQSSTKSSGKGGVAWAREPGPAPCAALPAGVTRGSVEFGRLCAQASRWLWSGTRTGKQEAAGGHRWQVRMAGSGWGPPRLDGFILTERLGSGTYATVYKAYAKVSAGRGRNGAGELLRARPPARQAQSEPRRVSAWETRGG